MSRRASLVLAVVTIVLGLAVVARTAAEGVGGGLGFVLGGLMALAGALRLYLLTR